MFETYYRDGSVTPDFSKEFVSIFDGWLGTENMDQLDQVTDNEWSRFNTFLGLLMQSYDLYLADRDTGRISPVKDIEEIMTNHAASQGKQASQFTHIVIPELGAVYAEDWDYTSILWHKNKGAVDALEPLIRQAGLFNWSDPGG